MSKPTDQDLLDVVQALNNADVPEDRYGIISKQFFLEAGGTEEEWQAMLVEVRDE